MRKIQTIEAELIKARHNRIYMLCGALALLLPLLVTIKDCGTASTRAMLSAGEWMVSTRDLCLTLALPLFSGMILTQLFQKEYTERTIINQLTSPISRIDFLTGKLAAWAAFHMGMCLLSILGICIGVFFVYPGQADLYLLLDCIRQSLLHGLLMFLVLTPLLAVAVFQKVLFYPSVLLCLLFTLIAGSSYVLPGNLPFLLPWSAARVTTLLPLTGPQTFLCAASIGICFLSGILLAVVGFCQQNI